MGKINSKDKGKRYELELAHKLSSYGFECRRTQQFCGANGNADVEGLPLLHIEAKHQETLHIYDWIAQAESDARENEVPVVIFRKNHKPDNVIISLNNFMEMYKAWLQVNVKAASKGK